MNIGENIRRFREKKKMSQDDLALKLYISRQTISNWETNKTIPDVNSLVLLSDVFGVSVDELLKGSVSEIRTLIDELEMKKFNKLSAIFSIELVLVVISVYPLLKLLHIYGIFIWAILFLITLFTSLKIEKFKNKYDIATLKEIIAFVDGDTLTHDEVIQEKGKRMYQKVFAAIISGIISATVLALIYFIFEHIL